MLLLFNYLIIAILCFTGTHTVADLERKFVSILFRHGDRTPVCYNLGYQFSNEAGELTKAGMQREYELGLRIREEYGDLLGKTYYPRIAITRSTDIDRTKMSLQLVMAGIFPPIKEQRWNNNILWQPVIVDYVPGAYDFLLTPDSCPKYKAESKNVNALPEVQEKTAKFNDLMKYLTQHIGQPVNSMGLLTCLYTDLVALSSMGLKLPSWSAGIFPNGLLLDGTILYWDLSSYNQKLMKLNGGMILKNFTDTASAIINGHGEPDTKMLLLSGHDSNVAALLIALNIHESFEPQYSGAIFLELLKYEHEYYVRIYYYMGIPAVRKLIAIPNCEDPCLFDEFIALYQAVLPTEEEMCSLSKDVQQEL